MSQLRRREDEEGAGTTRLPPINKDHRSLGRNVEMIDVESIEIRSGRRGVSDEAVETIAASMASIGLQTPISVKYYSDRPASLAQDEASVDALVLLAGAHRLAAAKKLGWGKIECIVHYDGDEIDAQLWEIAENLHRSGLTKEQRDEHIRRYAELLSQRQSTQVAPIESKRPDGKGHRRQGVASQIAAETGVSKDTVRRALNPDRIAAEQARREAEKAAERAEAEQRAAEVAAGLPAETRQVIEQQKARREAAKASADIDQMLAEIEELREANAALEQENADLRLQVAKYDDMVTEYERGGFDNVIAGLQQRNQLLARQVERESQEKVANLRSAAYWKRKAIEAGANDDVMIDMATGEMSRG